MRVLGWDGEYPENWDKTDKLGWLLDKINALVEGEAGKVGFHFKMVDELPEIGEESYFYLVPAKNSTGQDIYEEYLWVENSFEKLGSTDLQIENYYTKSEIDQKDEQIIQDTTTTFNAVKDEMVTKEEFDSAAATKTELAKVRSDLEAAISQKSSTNLVTKYFTLENVGPTPTSAQATIIKDALSFCTSEAERIIAIQCIFTGSNGDILWATTNVCITPKGFSSTAYYNSTLYLLEISSSKVSFIGNNGTELTDTTSTLSAGNCVLKVIYME